MRKDGKLPPLETILESFRKKLKRGRLIDFEEESNELVENRYSQVITRLKKDAIRGSILLNFNFAKQHVVVTVQNSQERSTK